MTLERAFMQSILQTPEDDTLRLVYTDWLEENGQSERAEFIRLEVEMARLVPDPPPWFPQRWDQPHYCDLRSRAEALFKSHRKSWFGTLEKLVPGEYSTARGFTHHISLTARKFIARADEIFLAAPTIEDVMIVRLGRNTPALARCRTLEHVRSLEFFKTPFRAPEMEELAGSPYLSNLRQLEIPFTDTWIGPRGALALAGASSIERLEVLDLRNHAIYDEGAAHLFRSRWSAGLRRLKLGNNGLTDTTADWLGASGHLGGLRHLDLDMNHLTARGVQALAEADHLQGLEVLDLRSNPIGNEGARALGEPGRFRNLTSLKLGRCDLSDLGCAALIRNAPDLLALDLSFNWPHQQTFAELAAARHLGRLRRLDLFACAIAPFLAAALGRVDSLPQLRHLGLSSNPLGPAGVRALLAGPLTATLKRLQLDNCEIGDEGAEVLAASPALASLYSLSLDRNNISDRGVIALARSSHLKGLGSLSLNENPYGEAGKNALAARQG
jgi:uncharacterized protein (TIGR02996 family)